jgi:hypothetical protein
VRRGVLIRGAVDVVHFHIGVENTLLLVGEQGLGIGRPLVGDTVYWGIIEGHVDGYYVLLLSENRDKDGSKGSAAGVKNGERASGKDERRRRSALAEAGSYTILSGHSVLHPRSSINEGIDGVTESRTQNLPG